MKKILLLVVVVIIILTMGVGSWMRYQDDAIEVKLIAVEADSIESVIRVTGRIINDRTVTMTALVNGQIQGMLVNKGDRVKADQVLAFLDKREADALVTKATAVVARERQAVDETTRKWERLREISLTGGVTTQATEDAKALLNAARTRLQVAKAEQRVAQIHREKVDVTAPWDGVIIQKSAEQGQWVEAGIELFTLVAEEGREIEANVDAGDSGVIEIGQTVSLVSDAFPERRWNETIHWISPAIISDNNAVANSFAVRTTLSSDAPPLLLGQQMDIEIRTAYNKKALKLPYTALIESAQMTQVAIVENNKVKYIPVTTGIEDFTHVEILTGLVEGDLIIDLRGKSLKEGRSIKTGTRNN